MAFKYIDFDYANKKTSNVLSRTISYLTNAAITACNIDTLKFVKNPVCERVFIRYFQCVNIYISHERRTVAYCSFECQQQQNIFLAIAKEAPLLRCYASGWFLCFISTFSTPERILSKTSNNT